MTSYKTYLNNVLRNVPGSVYWKDREGIYLGCNDFQAKMAQLDSPEEIIGKSDYDLPWHSIADTLRATDKRVMETGIPEELIESPVFADGTEILMLSNKSPLYDEKGEIIGIIGTSLDISALKQAEKREKAALVEISAAEGKGKSEEHLRKAVMVLAASIAHDLRTPLVCIKSFSLVLQDHLPALLKLYEQHPHHFIPEHHLEALPTIPQEIIALIHDMNLFITDNLKSLSRSVSGDLIESDLVLCSSDRCISQALKAYPFETKPYSFQENRNPFQKRDYPFEETEEEYVQWDRSYYFNFRGNSILFIRVIFNLLSNSLYQIQLKKQGKIKIWAEEKETFNVLKFKDTAGGVTQELVDGLFQSFKTTKEHGTGVGLAFCDLTIKSLQGEMTAHCVDSEFIEFHLKFPKV